MSLVTSQGGESKKAHMCFFSWAKHIFLSDGCCLQLNFVSIENCRAPLLTMSTVSIVFPADCSSSKAEDRLFRKLFRRYNQFIRPVENVSDPVTVEFEVSISQLVKVVSQWRPHTHEALLTCRNTAETLTKLLVFAKRTNEKVIVVRLSWEAPSCACHAPPSHPSQPGERRKISRRMAEVKSQKWMRSLFSPLNFTDSGNVTQCCYTPLLLKLLLLRLSSRKC